MGRPIPLCAGCGRDEAPANSCLCRLCLAHLATSTPFRSTPPPPAHQAPTVVASTAPTLLHPAVL